MPDKLEQLAAPQAAFLQLTGGMNDAKMSTSNTPEHLFHIVMVSLAKAADNPVDYEATREFAQTLCSRSKFGDLSRIFAYKDDIVRPLSALYCYPAFQKVKLSTDSVLKLHRDGWGMFKYILEKGHLLLKAAVATDVPLPQPGSEGASWLLSEAMKICTPPLPSNNHDSDDDDNHSNNRAEANVDSNDPEPTTPLHATITVDSTLVNTLIKCSEDSYQVELAPLFTFFGSNNKKYKNAFLLYVRRLKKQFEDTFAMEDIPETERALKKPMVTQISERIATLLSGEHPLHAGPGLLPPLPIGWPFLCPSFVQDLVNLFIENSYPLNLVCSSPSYTCCIHPYIRHTRSPHGYVRE